MLDHLPPARHHLKRLGHILAELAQSAATTWAGCGCRVDDPLAWQMIGKRTARRLLPFKTLHLDLLGRGRGGCHLCRRLGLRGILFHVGKRKLELFQRCAPFRGLAEPLVAQLGDRELHLLDQQRPGAGFGLGILRLHLRLNTRRVLGNEHRFEHLDVIGQRIRGERHEANSNTDRGCCDPQSAS